MCALQRVLRLLALVAAVAVPAGLFYGGAQPYAVGLIPPPWDKFAHAGVFGLLAGAISYASGLSGARMWWLGFALAVLVGAADEWHQATLPGRAAGWDDLAADAVGAALGALALLLWRPRVHRWLEEAVVSRH
jgi:VanZ family protein